MTSDPTRPRDWIDDLPALTKFMNVTFGEPMVQMSVIRERYSALSTTPAADSLRAICVVCGERGHVRSTGGTVLTGGHDNPSGHEFTPATDFSHVRSTP